MKFFLIDKIIDLEPYEKKYFSQHNEDGVIQKLFQIIGVTNKYYVEFGVESGLECNTRYLRENLDWSGLLMDCDNENLKINLHREFISAENINDLFKKYNVPKHFDLLSIDIDYNDYYVWKSLNNIYKPRVLVIEHNATHFPTEDKIVKYKPFHFWDNTNYFGASIKAFYNLGREKGYSLVYSENSGVNLFFVRDDILEKGISNFKDINNVELIYKSPKYGKGPNGGHVRDLRGRKYLSSKNIRYRQFFLKRFLKFIYFFKDLISSIIEVINRIIILVKKASNIENITIINKILKFNNFKNKLELFILYIKS